MPSSEAGKSSDQMEAGQEEAMRIARNPKYMGCKERLVGQKQLLTKTKQGENGNSLATYKGVKNIFSCPLRIKEKVISSKSDLGVDFR